LTLSIFFYLKTHFVRVCPFIRFLRLRKSLPAVGRDQVVRVVPLVSAAFVVFAGQEILHDDGVVAPLQDSRPLGERNHLVLPDLEATLPGIGVLPQQRVHEAEDLLHHGILTKIVATWGQCYKNLYP
jgi:hypothetical protein